MPIRDRHEVASVDVLSGAWAPLVHTLGYLLVTAAIALVVYRKLGLSLLRRASFNLDLLWAVALILTGCLWVGALTALL